MIEIFLYSWGLFHVTCIPFFIKYQCDEHKKQGFQIYKDDVALFLLMSIMWASFSVIGIVLNKYIFDPLLTKLVDKLK